MTPKKHMPTPVARPQGPRPASRFNPTHRRPNHAALPLKPKIGASFSRGKLRVAVIGGAEEVGRNMTMVEYENDILLIDCGLQFPEEDMPGIDYIIPNVSSLAGKEDHVRGIVITHAHYDHIGGIPFVVPTLHNPPVYGTRLTCGIIMKRQEDFPEKGKLDLRQIDHTSKVQMGQLTVEFFRVNHSVPDSLGVIVHSPEGTIMHTGDFKFDYTPIGDQVTDFAKIAAQGSAGVLALLSDSTNASKPGYQISESVIGRNLEEIMAKAPGRLIIGTFASNLNRVMQIIWSAEKLGKRVVVEGYGMRTNVEIARALGYLHFSDKTIISSQDAQRVPPNRLVIVGTGAQGEDRAALMRIASKEHRFFQIEKGDTVIFSSSVIPGNERTVQKLKDTLLRSGARVVHYQMMDVHAGGHAQQEDLKLLYRLVNPKYIVPIEGNHFLLRAAADIAMELGWPEDRVLVPSNGQVMEFKESRGVLTDEKLNSDYIFVDGLGVGDVSEVVLRDRKLMAEDGMVVVIVTVDTKTGELVGSPDIISRGFVYMKGSAQLIDDTRDLVKKVLKDRNAQDAANPMYIKNKLRENLGQFLFQKTERRPMILPVVIEV